MALLLKKGKTIFPDVPTSVKPGVGSGSGSESASKWKSDTARHQNDADSQHCKLRHKISGYRIPVVPVWWRVSGRPSCLRGPRCPLPPGRRPAPARLSWAGWPHCRWIHLRKRKRKNSDVYNFLKSNKKEFFIFLHTINHTQVRSPDTKTVLKGARYRTVHIPRLTSNCAANPDTTGSADPDSDSGQPLWPPPPPPPKKGKKNIQKALKVLSG